MNNYPNLWNASQEHLDLFLDIEASMTPEQKAEVMKPIDFEAEIAQAQKECMASMLAEAESTTRSMAHLYPIAVRMPKVFIICASI